MQTHRRDGARRRSVSSLRSVVQQPSPLLLSSLSLSLSLALSLSSSLSLSLLHFSPSSSVPSAVLSLLFTSFPPLKTSPFTFSPLSERLFCYGRACLVVVVCVCMYVCVYVCVWCVCVYVCVWCVYMCVCMVCVYVCMCVYMCMYVWCVYVCMCVRVSVYAATKAGLDTNADNIDVKYVDVEKFVREHDEEGRARTALHSLWTRVHTRTDWTRVHTRTTVLTY